ncbi:MAG: hypothetical protein GC154_02305 [bacterium]|nr:hypothetical protein [bacterium]
MTTRNRTQSVLIESRLSELERTRMFVTEFCLLDHESKPVEMFLHQMVLAVNEAAANIIQHAYAQEPDHSLELILERADDHLLATLLHHGDPFDPSMEIRPAFDGTRSSGFGVYIIHNAVDEAVYGEWVDGRHFIRLTKRIWRTD